ncbi:hypothetical protein [Hyalangium rubrum]|uniref:Uncharacterized protein n=1 Tax=Hyalangium rubrum TaxID=3103134 RepID=A0ABU5H125_9BACT|nr:hypothetical protein [Hyalangium sp. s54d21]MDY7227150.1 hypothetical protein [Hyalangium sp. s54d21]
MGVTSLSLELKPKKPSQEPELDDEAWEELFDEVNGLLSAYLEKHLRRAAEAGFLEDIDAGCVVELDHEDCENGRLTFRFNDSWALGAEAAAHWYTLALAACFDEVETVLGKRGFKSKRLRRDVSALARKGTGTLPLVAIGTELVGVDKRGELMSTEGVELELSAKDKALIAKAAKTRQCQCKLCEKLLRRQRAARLAPPAGRRAR